MAPNREKTRRNPSGVWYFAQPGSLAGETVTVRPPLGRNLSRTLARIITRSVSEGGVATCGALRFMPRTATTSSAAATVNRDASIAYASRLLWKREVIWVPACR